MKNILLISCLLITASCTGTKVVRGSLIKDYEIAKLRQGSSTKQQVMRILGSPSSTSTLDDNKWYYITDYTQTKPLEKTKVNKRTILVLTFKDGILDYIEDIKDSKEKNFYPDSDQTKTQGEKLGVVDQFIQNLTSGLK